METKETVNVGAGDEDFLAFGTGRVGGAVARRLIAVGFDVFFLEGEEEDFLERALDEELDRLGVLNKAPPARMASDSFTF